MKQKSYANFSTLLAIFLGSVFVCSPLAGAAIQDNGSDEKLLAAIRDAGAQTARAFLYNGADVNARDDDGLTALMYAASEAARSLSRNISREDSPTAATNGSPPPLRAGRRWH